MAINRVLPNESGRLSTVSTVTSRDRQYKDVDLTFESKLGNYPQLLDSDRVIDGVEGQSVLMRGDIYNRIDVGAVLQAVKTIVMTNKYEKPFKPLFGADLNFSLFELNNGISSIQTTRKVKNAIESYEPRAEVLNVSVTLSPDQYYVSLEVTIKMRNSEDQFAFTTKLNRLR